MPRPRAAEIASAKLADEPYAPPKARSPLTIVGRLAIVVLVLGLTTMWIYALWGDPGVPGKLEDTTFPKAAQPLCQATHDQIEALPKAHTTPDPNVRADVVDQATGQLEALLTQLEQQVPTGQPAHDMVASWLADYRTYAKDRRDYTEQLRRDPTTRFAVTQSDRDKVQVTSAMDRFARINDMPACMIPDDLS